MHTVKTSFICVVALNAATYVLGPYLIADQKAAMLDYDAGFHQWWVVARQWDPAHPLVATLTAIFLLMWLAGFAILRGFEGIQEIRRGRPMTKPAPEDGQVKPSPYCASIADKATRE